MSLCRKCSIAHAAGGALLAAVALCAAELGAIETGYGEDPVPTMHRSLEPPYTAYGMDPIPVESPLERWLEFRSDRQQKQTVRVRRPSYPTDGGWQLFRRPR